MHKEIRNPLALAVLLSCITSGVGRTAAIERAVVAQTGPDAFSIAIDASAAVYPIRIFSIPQPGRPGPAKQLASVRKSPAEVHVPAGTGQPFFRLAPRKGPAVVVSIRRLPLEGAPNFRDLGGYRTADGHHLRWGTVYRSGQLSALTEGDYKYLSNLGIRLVCDFRVDAERGRAPTKWQGAPSPEIVASSIDTVSYSKRGMDTRDHMKNVYTRMPFDGSTQYAALFRRIINGDTPVLMHCTSGKDRTGFFAALLLTILGVPHEIVVEDFMLTNKYLVPDERIPELARQMQERQKLAALPDAETVRAGSGVLASNLEIGFAVIREKYGTVENYAREALKLSKDDLSRLRARLLE
jgi:protein-tyrosine phosphatase